MKLTKWLFFKKEEFGQEIINDVCVQIQPSRKQVTVVLSNCPRW